jgi:hypothetical protein
VINLILSLWTILFLLFMCWVYQIFYVFFILLLNFLKILSYTLCWKNLPHDMGLKTSIYNICCLIVSPGRTTPTMMVTGRVVPVNIYPPVPAFPHHAHVPHTNVQCVAHYMSIYLYWLNLHFKPCKPPGEHWARYYEFLGFAFESYCKCMSPSEERRVLSKTNLKRMESEIFQ